MDPRDASEAQERTALDARGPVCKPRQMIDDGEKARRLARAIFADVMLYNAAVKDAPLGERSALINGPLLEGRELYLSRVTPALASLFDEAVVEFVAKPLGILGLAPQAAAPQPAPSTPARVSAPLREPEAEKGPSSKLVLVVAIIVLAIAAAAFLLKQ